MHFPQSAMHSNVVMFCMRKQLSDKYSSGNTMHLLNTDFIFRTQPPCLQTQERKARLIPHLCWQYNCKLCTRAPPKVTPPVSFCWHTMSDVDVGAMTVDEPSYQYFITFWCHVTDGSREAVWQNSIWHRSMYEAKVWNWILPCRKKKKSTHLVIMLAECLWRPNSGCQQSKAMGGAFQQCWKSDSR